MTVRASGGVVHRNATVLLVHRPRYDDWAFPKGKALDGESDEDCALREVYEETGLRCELEEELGTTTHSDAESRPKRVRWWVMRPLIDDGFTPGDEVDELRWLPVKLAVELLTYETDRALLDAYETAK
ncbi:MAG TPA: NUDIX hydrolase [Gaiellaceae bacterium]|nr:NUDIX hydrolase [Gaiellaceae bacterium]